MATRVATRYLQASAEDIVTQWLRSPAGVKVIETDLKMVMARDVEYIQNRSLDYHIDDDRVAGRAKKWLMGLSSFSNAVSVGATGLEDKLVALIESTAGRAVHGAKVGKYQLSAETNKGELWLFWEGAVFGSPGTEDEEAERGTSGPDQDILDRAFVGAGFTDVRFEVDNDGPVTPSMDENDEFYWVYTVKLDLAVPLKRFLDQVPTKDLIGMARSVPKMALNLKGKCKVST